MEALMELYRALNLVTFMGFFGCALIFVGALAKGSQGFVLTLAVLVSGFCISGLYVNDKYVHIARDFFKDQVDNHGCVVKIERDSVKCKSPYGITYTRFEN